MVISIILTSKCTIMFCYVTCLFKCSSSLKQNGFSLAVKKKKKMPIIYQLERFILKAFPMISFLCVIMVIAVLAVDLFA